MWRGVTVACVAIAAVVVFVNAGATGTSEAALPAPQPVPLAATAPVAAPAPPPAPVLPVPTQPPAVTRAPAPSMPTVPASPTPRVFTAAGLGRPSAPAGPAPTLASPPVVAGPPPAPRFVGLVDRVTARDLPDPFILRDGATWWVYATGSGAGNLQVASSTDLRAWGPSADPLPTLPSWAAAGSTWSPAVLPRAGHYVLYYTARDAALGRQCISAAVAAAPAGPFVDTSAGPMICQTSEGGSIDPAPFVAPDGTAYLLWKSDDNALGTRTRIGGQRLSPDGLSLVGLRPALLSATSPWEDGVVEGPAMVTAAGHYYLFYGANHWDTPGAGVGYAVCTTPLGPCTNESVSGPWLASQGPIVGPSGPAPFVDGGGVVHLAFHGWATGADGQPVRALWMGQLAFGG